MRRFLHILFSILFVTQVMGQTKINYNSFDYDLLEKLVFEKVNDLRKSKKLDQLTDNKILGVAAQNQSNYQSKKKRMTHNQTSSKTKFVWLRVQNAGGDFSAISENVAYTDTYGFVVLRIKGKKVRLDASTYEGAAEILYLGWKNSKPHYKAMIDKRFNLSGLKFKLNPKTKRLYATQVFAKG